MRNLIFSAVFLTFVVSSTTLFAGPMKGFGLFAGTASHTTTDEALVETSTSGMGFGLDYQWVFKDILTSRLMMNLSNESLETCANCNYSNTIVGLEGRYWMGDFFAGLHAGSLSHSVTTENPDGTINDPIVGSGSSAGLSLGYEAPGGFIANFLTVFSSIEFEDGTTADLSGVRLLLGYRWGKK